MCDLSWLRLSFHVLSLLPNVVGTMHGSRRGLVVAKSDVLATADVTYRRQNLAMKQQVPG
jgi:hypothetical protein